LSDTFDSSQNGKAGEIYVCEYFRNTITLFPDGQITQCCKYVTFPEYNQFPNIFTNNISEILNSELLLKHKNLLMKDFHQDNEECADCKNIARCNGGCRMEAYLESKNISSKCNRTCLLMKNAIAYE
jgi:radical SAM protein with 4Fe4S-binding SPASM domain